jgi:hypothetical protein
VESDHGEADALTLGQSVADRPFPQVSTEEEIDANRHAAAELYELHARTFATLEGAASLVGLYGDTPSFHDGEITDLNLRRKGESKLRVRIPFPDIYGHGSVFVTFEIGQVLDVSLEGFSPQNVIFSLNVMPNPPNAEREAHYGIMREQNDVKIELEPTWGVGGHLICRDVKVAWTMDHIARKLPRNTPGADLLGQ